MAQKKNSKNCRKLTPFGRAVKKKLIDRGMSQGQLEKEIGAPFNYVTQVLHGQRNESKYVRIIGEYLDIDVSKYSQSRGA